MQEMCEQQMKTLMQLKQQDEGLLSHALLHSLVALMQMIWVQGADALPGSSKNSSLARLISRPGPRPGSARVCSSSTTTVTSSPAAAQQQDVLHSAARPARLRSLHTLLLSGRRRRRKAPSPCGVSHPGALLGPAC